MSFGFAVGDFIAVSKLAWALYRDCYMVARGAPQEFQQLKGEISNLCNSLNILQEEVKNPDSTLRRAGDDRVRMVNEMVSRIDVTLKELEKAKDKFTVLGDASRRRRIWGKLKWSIECSNIDALRSKLIYHNTVITLLLTSVGNSSLNRLETTFDRLETTGQAIEAGQKEIIGYITALGGHRPNEAITPPLLSGLGDDPLRIHLSMTLMRNAEVSQPWTTIGLDRWVHAGKWWLMKFQADVISALENHQPVPKHVYANLIKASWILIDIIACHPQISFASSSVQYEIQILSIELKEEFQKLKALQLEVPALPELHEDNLHIWEIQTSGWIGDRGAVYFQRFALYQAPSLPKPVSCLVLLDIDEKNNVGRIVGQDQTGTALMEVAISEEEAEAMAAFNQVLRSVKFQHRSDSIYLSGVTRAAAVYLSLSKRELRKPVDLLGLALILAIKREEKALVQHLLTSPNLTEQSAGSGQSINILSLASPLARDFLESTQGSCNSPNETERDDPFLTWAIQEGHTDLARLLLNYGLNPNVKRGDGLMSLHAAALLGNPALVQQLLDCKADLHACWNSHRTVCSPLELAAQLGHQDVVQMLLDHEAEMRNAITLAVGQGHEDIVRLLISYRPRVEREPGPDLHDPELKYSLLKAIEGRHETLVQLLLESGAKLDKPEKASYTALQCAAMKGEANIVQKLIEYGADVNDMADGHPPLYYGIISGSESIVEELLSHGANVNRVTRHGSDIIGETALALSAGVSLKIVQLLLQWGATFDGRSNTQTDALWNAVCYEKEDIVAFLIAQGADISNMLYIERAVDLQSAPIVKLLLDYGADAKATSYGSTALYLAVRGQSEPMVKLLLDHGADVYHISDDTRVLHQAVHQQSEPIVKLLLDYGADVNAISSYGWTVLHRAVGDQSEPMVKLLLDHGAEVNVRRKYGKSPLQMARDQYSEGIMRLLLDRGANND